MMHRIHEYLTELYYNQMCFNIEKCNYMIVSNNTTPVNSLECKIEFNRIGLEYATKCL